MSIPPWTLRNTHIQSGATIGGYAIGITWINQIAPLGVPAQNIDFTLISVECIRHRAVRGPVALGVLPPQIAAQPRDHAPLRGAQIRIRLEEEALLVIEDQLEEVVRQLEEEAEDLSDDRQAQIQKDLLTPDELCDREVWQGTWGWN